MGYTHTMARAFRTLAPFLAVFWMALGTVGCEPRPEPAADSAAPKAPATRPGADRIIFVVIDTLRGDHVGGERVPTPNLDALAARGQRIPNALASYFQTTMSMGALFTGHTPSLESAAGGTLEWNGRTWCGLSRFDRGDSVGCIPPTIQSLGELMKGAGYETIGLVANELLFAPSGLERGFDEWREMPAPARKGRGRRPGANAWYMNLTLEKILDERQSDHFFLYMHYMDVHDFRSRKTTYPRQVEYIDEYIGQLVELLEKRDLMEGTVFVLTADHGHRLGEKHLLKGGTGHRGNPSFEEVLDVPLITVPALFDDPPRGLRGEDVFELLLDQAGIDHAVPAVLESDELYLSEGRWQTYRKGRWKSYRRRGGKAHRLVDLEADPGETKDVARAYPEVVDAHRARMNELASELAGAPPARSFTKEDERRLRALGYLE